MALEALLGRANKMDRHSAFKPEGQALCLDFQSLASQWPFLVAINTFILCFVEYFSVIKLKADGAWRSRLGEVDGKGLWKFGF